MKAWPHSHFGILAELGISVRYLEVIYGVTPGLFHAPWPNSIRTSKYIETKALAGVSRPVSGHRNKTDTAQLRWSFACNRLKHAAPSANS